MWLTLLIACSTTPPTEKGSVLFDRATNAYEDPTLAGAIEALPTKEVLHGLAICGGDADLRVVGRVADHAKGTLLTHMTLSVERNVADWVITVGTDGRVVDVGEEGTLVHAVPFVAQCSRGNGAETHSVLATLRADGTLEK